MLLSTNTLYVQIYRMVSKCLLHTCPTYTQRWRGEYSTSHIHSSTHPLSHIHLSHSPHTHPRIESLSTPTPIHTCTRTVTTHTFFFFLLFFRVVEEDKMACTKIYQHSDYRSCPLSKLSVLKEGLVFWVTFLVTQGGILRGQIRGHRNKASRLPHL